MDIIIDFYKSLDTLNLIIFWGIIIVIILLLIFSTIMINKNKKLNKIIHEKNNVEEDLPIKKESISPKETTTENINKEEIVETTKKEEIIEIIENDSKIENIDIQEHKPAEKKPIEMPTGPYQRNVLREMSLSQTSPIGINRQVPKENKKTELAQELNESLKEEIQEEDTYQIIKKIIQKEEKTVDLEKELEVKENIPSRQAIIKEIDNNPKTENSKTQDAYKATNVNYLEEVSRKLSEAEVPDEIERTDYELEQEENAIISYKELMEKKDSIQTIDEEDAVISIEELIQRKNSEEKENTKEEQKLYNINEQEDNDDFIKELKAFRKDLY